MEALVQTELASSNKMAREFIGNGAVSVNGEKVSDPAACLDWNQAFLASFSCLKEAKNSSIWAIANKPESREIRHFQPY